MAVCGVVPIAVLKPVLLAEAYRHLKGKVSVSINFPSVDIVTRIEYVHLSYSASRSTRFSES